MSISSEQTLIENTLGRKPTTSEAAMLEVMWSEHVSYKSSKRWFHLFNTESPDVYLGIGEGAGLIDIGNGYVIGLALESHNHPSAIDPFNGAATGVGGIIRDILSQGCRPIALLDAIRFGPLTHPRSRFLFEQVVQGIASYGNSVGVPTVGGEVEYDEAYLGNCLVNVMCVGIAPKDKIVRSIANRPGDLFVLFGASTGRDGIHGVTFASDDLAESMQEDRGSVQIGDPLIEKKLIDAVMELRDAGLINAMQDLGGGGLTCAVSEMCERGGTGCEIHLDRIAVREKDMEPWEILISESQERMLITCSPQNLKKVKEILDSHDLTLAVLGSVTPSKRFVAKYHDSVVADLPIDFLIEGFEEPERQLIPPNSKQNVTSRKNLFQEPDKLADEFQFLLSSSNIASKRWVYQQYDHTVQGNTVLEPGIGPAIIALENGAYLALSLDSLPFLTSLDPYSGAANSAMKGIRSVIATGAKPVALVDNLNFGNPEKPDSYWEFVEAIKGIAQVSHDFHIPVVGGNVSLYNEATINGKRSKILPTPVIGVAGIISSLESIVPQVLTAPDHLIAIVGPPSFSIDGSEYARLKDIRVKEDISYEPREEQKSISFLGVAQKQELLKSCKPVGRGGIITTLTKMMLQSNTGVKIDDSPVFSKIGFWVSEGSARYIVEFSRNDLNKIQELAKSKSVTIKILGKTINTPSLILSEDEQISLQTLMGWFETPIVQAMEV